MARLILTIFAIAIAQNCLVEANDPIREFLQLNSDIDHELVKIDLPNRLHKRESYGIVPPGTNMSIRAFGKNVDLWIHPRDSLLASEETPVYYARYSPYNSPYVDIRQQYGLMQVVGKIYEDPRKSASLVIGKDDLGRSIVNGRIESENLIVRSLPDSVVKAHADYRRSTDDVVEETGDAAYHVVYKGDKKLEEDYPLDIDLSQFRARLARSTYGVPLTLYPKVLLYLDYSIYEKQGRDIYGLLSYFLAFMNGIDLKYRALQNPNFRFHIGGIVIAVEAEGTPYISNHMLSTTAFDINIAMREAQEFFYQTRDMVPLNTFDIAVTITRHQLGESSGLLGQAWVGVTCRNIMEQKSYTAVTIFKDDGALSGVHVAAHELGHTFGLWHDPLNGSDCIYTNGFLMAFTPWYTKNSSSFSSCSLGHFQKNLDNQKYTCMYDKPKVNSKQLPKLMPGRLITLEKQCKSFGLGLPCNTTTTDICVNIYCLEQDGSCQETGSAALEGTECTDPNDIWKKYCIHNRCVSV